jgi:small subunit ribosomal protein S13
VPRIVGVDIPKEKRIEVALTYIHGIGPMRARAVLKEAGIGLDVRA